MEKFKSKSGFILASIGAAVGLGNALRFPGLCAKYGGGAFLLIYLIALIVLGVPLLNAEIAMGRRFKSGAPRCTAGMLNRPNAAAVGWAAGLNSALTAVIYAGLAGWIISTAANITPLCLKSADMPRAEISGYFFDCVLKSRNDGVIDGISPVVLCCVVAAWVLMYFCLKGGAGSLAKAAKFTVIIPLVILVLMAGRGLMYNNSGEALGALFIPDFSCLNRPDMWLTALGQVFFSLSVAVGIMPVYGSYLPEGAGIFGCSLAVAAADFLVSVLASVVLFTTLYGCGIQSAICDSGILTAFAVYPVAITSLFGSNAVLNGVFGILFYCSLAMMAVQSAVSMLEAFISPFADGDVKKKKKVVKIACLIGVAVSVLFSTSAAPLIIEVADLFINFYNVLILCIAECLILAFSKRTGGLVEEINKFSSRLKMPQKPFLISVKFLSPAILICLGVMEIFRIAGSPPGYPLWLITAFGAGLSVAVCAVSVVISMRRGRGGRPS
ncbi:MAG: hypothetical protein K2K80_06030 [Clostridia bacterium]|nr:hypothetical protein [Clostridia bacterium]